MLVPMFHPFIRIEGVFFENETESVEELGKAILLTDCQGYVRRIGLNEQISLHQYPTPSNLKFTGTDFYICSWVSIYEALKESDEIKRFDKSLEIISSFVRNFDEGVRKCGFGFDKTLIRIESEKCENAVVLDMLDID